MPTTARRALFTGLLAGGAATVVTASPANAATWTPTLVPRSKLMIGDLIVGPDSAVVRVSGVSSTSVTYTDPISGGDLPLSAKPLKKTQKFVVIARGVPAAAVRLSNSTPAPEGAIDGGTP